MQDVNIRVSQVKGTLYYFCIFSVSLKLFINEKIFKKHFKGEKAPPLEPVCLDLSPALPFLSFITLSKLYIEDSNVHFCVSISSSLKQVKIVFTSLNGHED